ncbi:MAG: DUF4157 domain-containing protein [Proteobacteria bacterium]|nr:DUF4157 domain-containing protein [Pseudomonadota bacterium]
MSMPEPQIQRQPEEEEKKEEELIETKPLSDQITPLVQRQVEEEKEEEEILLTKKREDTTPKVTHDLESSINALKGGGQPLPESVRAYFEPRFGYDFSGVRVHTDAKAAESAQAVNAMAYTVGSDVVFRSQQYAPRTNGGRKLLAHELTHVVQQAGGEGIRTSAARYVFTRLRNEPFDIKIATDTNSVMTEQPVLSDAISSVTTEAQELVQRQVDDEYQREIKNRY